MYDQSRTKRSVWMKDWRVIELTFPWTPNISIETMTNRERNKASDESWEHDCTYYSLVTDAPIKTTIHRKRNKGWSEWSKSDWAYFSAMNDDPNESIINLEKKKRWNEKSKWSDLLFLGHRCLNECIDLSTEKQKSALNIDGWWSLLLRAERWSNPIETTIILEGNKGLSETLKGDRAYLSAMTDESNSMETTINLERNKDLNESLLSDRIYFSGTEWVLYSMRCNERW